MSFADRYIQRNLIYPEFIKESIDFSLGLIVVVPVYNEPDLVQMLDSLASCERPNQETEVLLVINQSENSDEALIIQNQKTVKEVEQWKIAHPEVFFQVHILLPPPFRKKHAGAGLARKVGMDEAIRRFACIENENGILISLDADTLVAPNYLLEIETYFNQNHKSVGVCIDFKHRIDEINDATHRDGMLLYEKYLHYYKNALDFTGYPHAIHTVGSAFAVKADAYVKQGGMNRRQAGEDFYFLHKLSQLDKLGELSTTRVFPSARLSDRVPFGTGPVLQKWMEGDQSLTETYRFEAFHNLKDFFHIRSQLYELDMESCKTILNSLSPALTQFLKEDNFIQALEEIKLNSSRIESFEKRFYQYFNAFKILKFLNFAHPILYPFQNLHEAEAELKIATAK